MTQKKAADALMEQCCQAYRVKLFNYCLSRLDGAREAADDCVQEAFLVLYRTLRGGETVAHPQAFLYRTADQFVKRQRQQQAAAARRELPLAQAEDREASALPENDRLALIDYDALAVALVQTLSPEEQTLYERRYVRRERVEAIAQELQISRPAASMRLVRLREKIIQLVKQMDMDQEGV